MEELTPEQFQERQESANIQAKAFISDPRHARYIETEANNSVLVKAISEAGLEWNAENLHQVFTENLSRLELKADPNAQPTGTIREGDIDFNVLRARQAAAEQRKANDALLATQEQERLRLEAERKADGENVAVGLAAQQTARRQLSAPVQFRNGRPITSESLPTPRNHEALVRAGERHATELRQDASRRRHL
jgi:hypothetical protein